MSIQRLQIKNQEHIKHINVNKMRLQKKNMIQIVKFRPQADNGEKNGVKTSMPKKMTQ